MDDGVLHIEHLKADKNRCVVKGGTDAPAKIVGVSLHKKHKLTRDDSLFMS